MLDAELMQGLQNRKEEILKALEETRLANAALCRKVNRKLMDCQRKDAELIAKLQEQIKRVEILTPDGTKRTIDPPALFGDLVDKAGNLFPGFSVIFKVARTSCIVGSQAELKFAYENAIKSKLSGTAHSF